MVNVGDTIHEGGGTELYEAIAEAARLSIQEWTGLELTSTSVYGIRIYKEGSVLAPHVDRLPLISSAIINVDQDVDEPWPLEVIGHNGVAENVTMLPGDLVLYESHSVIHGMIRITSYTQNVINQDDSTLICLHIFYRRPSLSFKRKFFC